MRKEVVVWDHLLFQHAFYLLILNNFNYFESFVTKYASLILEFHFSFALFNLQLKIPFNLVS